MEHLSEKQLHILRLFELIGNVNRAIAAHQTRGQSGAHAVEQYQNRKKLYEKELLELLSKEFNLNWRLAAAA